MKNSSFENNLKTITQGFEVGVNQQQFNRVMELRAQQNKRKKMWWWFGSVAAVVIGVVFFVSITQDVTIGNKNPNVHHPIKTHVESPIYTQRNKRKSTTTSLNNIQSEDKKLNQSKIPLTPNKHTKSKASNKTPKYQSNPIKNSIRFFGDDTANNLLKLTTINKPMLVDAPLYNQTIITKLNMDLPKENLSFKMSDTTTKTKRFNGVYIDATYLPFTSAKNASSLIPDNKANMVGLTEDANFAYAVNIGATFNLSKNIQLLTGIGIHTIRFDKIREATINIDTMPESLINTAATLNFERVADLSFTWLDAPIALRYNKPINNKFNWYAQVGLNYRYLVQNKAYVFQIDSNQKEHYELRTNHANNRVNIHQLSIVIEPGLTYNLTRNIAINLGVPFQHDLLAVYHKTYLPRDKYKLIGAKVGIQFNF
jgi:opacity protein-like surface antigen